MIAVLFTAQGLGSPSQKEIADHTRIDRTTVSETIERLEAGAKDRAHAGLAGTGEPMSERTAQHRKGAR
jgi:hypothetical protein